MQANPELKLKEWGGVLIDEEYKYNVNGREFTITVLEHPQRLLVSAREPFEGSKPNRGRKDDIWHNRVIAVEELPAVLHSVILEEKHYEVTTPNGVVKLVVKEGRLIRDVAKEAGIEIISYSELGENESQ